MITYSRDENMQQKGKCTANKRAKRKTYNKHKKYSRDENTQQTRKDKKIQQR